MQTWYASPTIPQHTLNFLSPDKCRCEQKVLTLDWVPASLKSKSWDWLGRFATAARLPILLCVHYSKESRKKEASYGAGRDSDAASCLSTFTRCGGPERLDALAPFGQAN